MAMLNIWRSSMSMFVFNFFFKLIYEIDIMWMAPKAARNVASFTRGQV